MFLVRYCSNSAVDEEHKQYCQLLNSGGRNSDEWNRSLTGDFHEEVQMPHSRTQRRRLLERIAMKHAPQLLKKFGKNRNHIPTQDYDFGDINGNEELDINTSLEFGRFNGEHYVFDAYQDIAPGIMMRTPSPRRRQSMGASGPAASLPRSATNRPANIITGEALFTDRFQKGMTLSQVQMQSGRPLREIRLDPTQISPSMSSPSCSIAHHDVDEQYLHDVFPPFQLQLDLSSPTPNDVAATPNNDNDDNIDAAGNDARNPDNSAGLDRRGHAMSRVSPAAIAAAAVAEQTVSPAFSDPPTFLQLSGQTPTTATTPSQSQSRRHLHLLQQRRYPHQQRHDDCRFFGNQRGSRSSQAKELDDGAVSGSEVWAEVVLADAPDSPSTITMPGFETTSSDGSNQRSASDGTARTTSNRNSTSTSNTSVVRSSTSGQGNEDSNDSDSAGADKEIARPTTGFPRRQLWRESYDSRTSSFQQHSTTADRKGRKDSSSAYTRSSSHVGIDHAFGDMSAHYGKNRRRSSASRLGEGGSHAKENRKSGNARSQASPAHRRYVDPFDHKKTTKDAIDWDYSFIPLSSNRAASSTNKL